MDDDYLHMFLEYIPGGSIIALLHNYGAFEEHLVRSFSRQVLTGLEYLHIRGVVHGGIKAAHILVDNKGTAKISNFRNSKKMAAGECHLFCSLPPNCRVDNAIKHLQSYSDAVRVWTQAVVE
jgi:serine/threonine protein kinase